MNNNHNTVYPANTPIGSVLNSLSTSAHANAVSHGFYDDEAVVTQYLERRDEPKLSAIVRRDFVLSQLAKISCEVGEAVDAIQHGEELKLYEELADVIIRTIDLAGFLDCKIGDWVVDKMNRNKKRPYKHGKEC